MKNQNALFHLWFWVFYFFVAIPCAAACYSLYAVIELVIAVSSAVRKVFIWLRGGLHVFIRWFLRVSPRLDTTKPTKPVSGE